MADDLQKTGRHDDERINVDQHHQVRYWAEKLGLSSQQLREAVEAAGRRPCRRARIPSRLPRSCARTLRAAFRFRRCIAMTKA